MLQYSIGLTTKNCEALAKTFVETLHLEDRTPELVVVDAGSDDGTIAAFRQYDGPVRIETVPDCTRGEGRQRAVELATRDHIISEIDPDIRYSGLEIVLDAYEELHEGDDRNQALLVRGNNGLLVAPTALIEKYPYRPIQYREDHALHDRLYKAGALRVLGSVPTVTVDDGVRTETVTLPSGEEFVAEESIKDRSPADRFRDMYHDAQAMYRIGFPIEKIFAHYARNLSPALKPLTIAFVAGSLLADGPRYSDALAHCTSELHYPLRHECYVTE